MTPLAHRQFFPQEWEALLHYNGFAVDKVEGDFHGGPLDRTSDVMVWHARARRAMERAMSVARGWRRCARASSARRAACGRDAREREARRRVEDEAGRRRSARRTPRGSARSARTTRRSWRRRRRRSRTCAEIEWHFIGHLQTNKAKLVAKAADVVHTVDSAVARARAGQARRCRPSAPQPLPVLIEVNVGGGAAEARGRPERDRRGHRRGARRAGARAPRPHDDAAVRRSRRRAARVRDARVAAHAPRRRGACSPSCRWGCPRTWRSRSPAARRWSGGDGDLRREVRASAIFGEVDGEGGLAGRERGLGGCGGRRGSGSRSGSGSGSGSRVRGCFRECAINVRGSCPRACP